MRSDPPNISTLSLNNGLFVFGLLQVQEFRRFRRHLHELADSSPEFPNSDRGRNQFSSTWRQHRWFQFTFEVSLFAAL
jgi:hypothetical protein